MAARIGHAHGPAGLPMLHDEPCSPPAEVRTGSRRPPGTCLVLGVAYAPWSLCPLAQGHARDCGHQVSTELGRTAPRRAPACWDGRKGLELPVPAEPAVNNSMFKARLGQCMPVGALAPRLLSITCQQAAGAGQVEGEAGLEGSVPFHQPGGHQPAAGCCGDDWARVLHRRMTFAPRGFQDQRLLRGKW